jgi:hypothetical protein
MPKLCEHCGKMHATQEELDAGMIERDVSTLSDEPETKIVVDWGDDGSTTVNPEPFPHEIRAGEAPEELPEEFVPKRKKSKK